MKETSIDVIKGIIEDMGGTSTARGMVRVLKELRQVLSGGSSGGSSGGGAMVVNVTITVDEQTSSPVFTADKTFAEVYACLQGGSDVVAMAVNPSGDNIIARPFIFRQDMIAFALVAGSNNTGFSITPLSMYPDDSIVTGYGPQTQDPNPDTPAS